MYPDNTFIVEGFLTAPVKEKIEVNLKFKAILSKFWFYSAVKVSYKEVQSKNACTGYL